MHFQTIFSGTPQSSISSNTCGSSTQFSSESESSGSHGGYAEPNLAAAVRPYERSFAPLSGITLEGEDDPMEKIPVNSGENFGQSFSYPVRMSDSRESVVSVNTGWRHRQTIKRGVTRRVKLTDGNFIAEYRVPTAIHNAMEAQYTAARTTEFSHMRYTAATCDPDDFTETNGWSLRTKLYQRQTEILVAVTSYNEDKTLYARTLHGVMSNNGSPGWQKIVVALVVDGLEAMDKSVLDVLATVGVYQDGVMKRQVDGKSTVAHIFEYTTQLSIDHKPTLVLPQENDPANLVPVQIIFVLKAQNQKKINSHRWLFNAIGRMLNPEVCILIDAGTKPGRKSLYYLWEAFYNDKHLGGCCGEIHAMIKGGKKLLNPLVAAQNFEYKMSNILDKPLESSFGYVSVLPGAFSAYRYRAVLGRPLEQYFHGDHSLADRLGDKGINGMSIFEKNMFLAEDRILCFELVAKRGERWTLTYVKPSKAETDVPESAAELIGQRRRWLNGSFAASVYALVNFYRLYGSGHGFFRMFFFHIQGLYNGFSLIFSWFALANLWLTFSIIIDLLPSEGIVFGSIIVNHWINFGLKCLYLGFLILQFVLALGNRPKGERFAYTLTLWQVKLYRMYLLVCSFWLMSLAFEDIQKAFQEHKSPSEIALSFFTPPIGPLVAAIISTFGIYFFASFLYNDPWHMFTSFIPYLCLAPSFVNVLNVYAFCNLHDVSWGTKGSDKADALPAIKSKTTIGADEPEVEDMHRVQEDIDAAFKETVTRALHKDNSPDEVERPTLDDENKTFRTRLVAAWMLTNGILAVGIENINGWLYIGDDGISKAKYQEFKDSHATKTNNFFAFILYSTFALAFVRLVGCLWYWFGRNLGKCCRRN
ncbi:putativechitin synthase [Hymenopellis radicata]|nr:putativechitin synthase [Hymenopellis radicata]